MGIIRKTNGLILRGVISHACVPWHTYFNPGKKAVHGWHLGMLWRGMWLAEILLATNCSKFMIHDPMSGFKTYSWFYISNDITDHWCIYQPSRVRTVVVIAIVTSSMTFLSHHISRWWRQTWYTIMKTHVCGFFDTDLHEVSWHFATHEAVRPSGF